MAVFAIVFTFINADKKTSVIVLFFCLAFFVFQLVNNFKEERISPMDSKILIKELEKRVEAVNLWDK